MFEVRNVEFQAQKATVIKHTTIETKKLNVMSILNQDSTVDARHLNTMGSFRCNYNIIIGSTVAICDHSCESSLSGEYLLNRIDGIHALRESRKGKSRYAWPKLHHLVIGTRGGVGNSVTEWYVVPERQEQDDRACDVTPIWLPQILNG